MTTPVTLSLDQDKVERIALEVIKVLYRRFNDFPADAASNRSAPFHAAFLQAFTDKLKKPVDVGYLISLSSWLHGLNTTLGQVFFENVAHILSDGQKREFTTEKRTQLFITPGQRTVISEIISGLKNVTRTPNLTYEDKELAAANALLPGETEVQAQDFTADNYVEDVTFIEAIELKSVRPNSGELRQEKQKILNGKAALRRKYNKDVRFFFGFPFDPWSNMPTSCDKSRFIKNLVEGGKYLDPSEVLLAGELWDRLSGIPNTMQQILDIIRAIATPKFLRRYMFLQDLNNLIDGRRRRLYLAILERWHLSREKRIVDNVEHLRTAGAANQRLIRNLNKWIFNDDGKYNEVRCNFLLAELITLAL